MFGFIGNIGPWELIVILLIALIVVGPGKLPEVAKGIGKATREFKKATSGVQKEINEVMKFDDDKASPGKNGHEAIKSTGKEKVRDIEPGGEETSEEQREDGSQV
ncbi:MAG: twin-arginine translocase TatA/TatE family subunit [Syntrophomonadaceae bacterium]|jgi:sec-independent protein translocase protein TatA|nr:twin-arginine translocase TatA/TatE family subunit [Syntrophomonadaceae bacterium]